jgi:hypothetical protein
MVDRSEVLTMKLILLRLFVCGLLTCTAVAPCFARITKKATPPPTHEPVISAVSGNTITVTDAKTAKTLTVTQFTEITVNGQKATFADLKPGMTVSVALSSPTQASRITATTKK